MSVDAFELSETLEDLDDKLGGGRGKTRTLSLGEDGLMTGRKSKATSSSKECSDCGEYDNEICDPLRPPSC